MRIINYMNLYNHPVQLSFQRDRTEEFLEIYHAHQGLELLYVHEGHGQVIVNQQILQLSPGCLVCFQPFQLHRIQMRIGPESRYVRSLFVFEPSSLEPMLAAFPSLRSFFHRIWKEPQQAPQLFAGLPRHHVDRMFEDYKWRIRQAPEELLLEEQMLFLVALLHMLRSHQGPMKEEDLSRPLTSSVAEQVMQWMEKHYMDPFELKRLAAALHLSPNYVSGVFRQTTGTSITEYLTARRIRQACLLLKSSDMSMQEIGRAIGLSGSSYFCNLFKKHVGISPYRYKRSN